MPRCMPDLVCRCCECQGKMCLVYHPGHSHTVISDWKEFLDEQKGKEKVSKSNQTDWRVILAS